MYLKDNWYKDNLEPVISIDIAGFYIKINWKYLEVPLLGNMKVLFLGRDMITLYNYFTLYLYY